MTSSRAKDWAIGAAAMLLLMTLVLVITWWAISRPLTDGATPTPEPTPTGAPDRPAALAADEIWVGDIDLSSDLVALPDTDLTDIRAEGHGALSSDDGLSVEWLEVEATVPFALVEQQLGGDSVVRPAAHGQASVQRTVDVLGRGVTVVATGTVEVVEGYLVVEPHSIDFGGPEFIGEGIAAGVRRFVTIEYPIEGLPENLELRDVDVTGSGFRARLSGNNVVLAEGA